MGLISRVSSRTYRVSFIQKKMFTRAFRQTTRYATAFNSVQHRQMYQVIIPKFTHYTPISAVKLDLSSNLVSSLSAEVQQMLLELSILEDDLEAEDESRVLLLSKRRSI